MKKLLALILVVGLLASFSGCTIQIGSDREEVAEKLESTVSNIFGYVSDLYNTTSGNEAIEDYLDLIDSQLDSIEDTYEQMGLDIDFYAENGDTLVYEYTYQQMVDGPSARQSIENSLDSNAQTFKSSLVQINSECGAVKKLKLVYRNADNALITSRTYYL